MKVFVEKYDRARRSPKTVKIEGYISHAFRRPREPCTKCRGISRGDMRWYIKDSHDFERAQ